MTDIIIPCYNPKEYIFEAIDSCLNQTSKDVKVTVVDDCSTVSIDYIIKRYPQVNFLRLDKNSGPAAARNFGIKNTNSKYISFLDDDDIMHKDKISISVKELDSDLNIKMICGNYSRIVNGHIQKDFYPKPININYQNLVRINFVASGSVTLRRDVLNDVGLFNEEYRICEDYDLWIRIAEKYNIKYLHQILYYYRVNLNSNSITQSDSGRKLELTNIRKILTESAQRVKNQ